ncbi:hypothetical protein B0T24DRAFT_123474 [Lasiosphaeria ovina]|uniref:Secreted protein n=1 Tax=Lasiosphaeria ovina TaxID=92902 RepID=A0AAE0MYB2_9PEZI|nr:hypothetical protein B0T24DRAFT_123474 [Lasiosphaeria ovina]
MNAYRIWSHSVFCTLVMFRVGAGRRRAGRREASSRRPGHGEGEIRQKNPPSRAPLFAHHVSQSRTNGRLFHNTTQASRRLLIQTLTSVCLRRHCLRRHCRRRHCRRRHCLRRHCLRRHCRQGKAGTRAIVNSTPLFCSFRKKETRLWDGESSEDGEWQITLAQQLVAACQPRRLHGLLHEHDPRQPLPVNRAASTGCCTNTIPVSRLPAPRRAVQQLAACQPRRMCIVETENVLLCVRWPPPGYLQLSRQLPGRLHEHDPRQPLARAAPCVKLRYVAASLRICTSLRAGGDAERLKRA